MRPPGGSTAATSGARGPTDIEATTSITSIPSAVPAPAPVPASARATASVSACAPASVAAHKPIYTHKIEPVLPPAAAVSSGTGRRFTTEEDVAFKEGIALYGLKKPAKIALHMGGTRTAEQVRERLKAAKKKAAETAMASSPAKEDSYEG